MAAQEVRLGVVGSLTVRRGGRLLTATDVGSRKARSLLAVLAVERGRLLPVEHIVDLLWGDARSLRPARDTATLVSRLRSVLGRWTVVGGRAGYRLGDAVRVDLDEAGALVDDADARLGAGELAQAVVAARRASDILDSGGVLDEMPDAEWAEPARVLHTVLLRRARHTAAEAALRTGDAGGVRSAARVAEAAMRADPYDETACRLLMRAFETMGETGRAVAAYARLRETLASDLGVDPAAETRDLHVALLRGEVIAVGSGVPAGTSRQAGGPTS